jgi:hypothetical protein
MTERWCRADPGARRTVARMRPLSDRVTGIDVVVCAAAASCEIDEATLALARVAAATFVRRHGDVCDYLADGGQPELLVADGLVPVWPSDAEVLNGMPLRGVEMTAVAAATLNELADESPAAVAACSVIAAQLRSVEHREFVEDVALDMLEAIVFAELAGLGSL